MGKNKYAHLNQRDIQLREISNIKKTMRQMKQTELTVPVYNDSTRPTANKQGRIIYNTDDGQLNIDTGSDWTLPDGTTT